VEKMGENGFLKILFAKYVKKNIVVNNMEIHQKNVCHLEIKLYHPLSIHTAYPH